MSTSAQLSVRRLLLALTVVATITFAPASAASAAPKPDGRVVRTWNDLAFGAVRFAGASDANAARLYAMVNAAMYDAVNGVSDDPQGYAIVPPSEDQSGDPFAAAATAAHDVLVAFRPTSAALRESYDNQLASDLSTVRPAAQAQHGQAWGATVAKAVITARENDGSMGNDPQAAGSGIGYFRLLWDTHQRHLRPFVIADPLGYVDAGPPDMTTEAYRLAFDDVKTVGTASYTAEDAPAIFQFWKLSGGSNQPAGAWLQIAESVSAARSLSLAETTRLFALESMALADTVAPTYETKRRYDYWRPETAIQEGDEDPNPVTTGDKNWTGRGPIALSPEHWSGHSSFSAAAATVLAGFFCRDDIPFTLVSDSGGGSARSYPSFSAAATQAGRSRVFGGQHFEFSNQAGLTAGRAIANEVLSKALRRTGGSSTTCAP